jgi:LuxR family maltose regulon positive regulatory protein
MLSPDTPVDRQNEEEMTAYGRYLLRCGSWLEAERVLVSVVAAARSRGRVQLEIQALAPLALAYKQSGRGVLALESLGRATMLGEAGRFTRTFVNEGLEMARLLESLVPAVRQGRGPAECGSPPYLTYLVGALSSGQGHAASDFLEPLTAREAEILKLIALGMMNQEIADQLVISIATVKRHIANAYGKLGVRHRTEAVARATALRIL